VPEVRLYYMGRATVFIYSDVVEASAESILENMLVFLHIAKVLVLLARQ
jgi:hypothetical protein